MDVDLGQLFSRGHFQLSLVIGAHTLGKGQGRASSKMTSSHNGDGVGFCVKGHVVSRDNGITFHRVTSFLPVSLLAFHCAVRSNVATLACSCLDIWLAASLAVGTSARGLKVLDHVPYQWTLFHRGNVVMEIVQVNVMCGFLHGACVCRCFLESRHPNNCEGDTRGEYQPAPLSLQYHTSFHITSRLARISALLTILQGLSLLLETKLLEQRFPVIPLGRQ